MIAKNILVYYFLKYYWSLHRSLFVWQKFLMCWRYLINVIVHLYRRTLFRPAVRPAWRSKIDDLIFSFGALSGCRRRNIGCCSQPVVLPPWHVTPQSLFGAGERDWLISQTLIQAGFVPQSAKKYKKSYAYR